MHHKIYVCVYTHVHTYTYIHALQCYTIQHNTCYYIPFHTIVVFLLTLFITNFFLHSSLQPMPEIEHNAPKFQYRIYWKKDKPGEEWQVRDEANWRLKELVIPNQPTYERYKIRVVAQVWSIIQTYSGITSI